jgi:RHS repeat-associated protein
VNGVIRPGSQTLSFDSANRVISFTYDAKGNILADGTYAYAWDAQNRLTKVSLVSSGALVASYAYDAGGMRTQATLPSSGTRYVTDELTGAVTALTDASGNVTTRFVRDSSGELLFMIKGTTTYTYLLNEHGDVTALADSSGAIVATWTYDAWGCPTEYNAAGTQVATGTFGNPFLYASYLYDTETSHYYLQARYYDPATARFLSCDPDPGEATDRLSLNPYIYCENGPTNDTDPNGHGFWSWAKKRAQRAVRAVSQVVRKTVTTAARNVQANVKKTAASMTAAVQKTGAAVKKAAVKAKSAAGKAAAKAGSAVKKAAEKAGSRENLARIQKGLAIAGAVACVAAIVVGTVATGGLLAAGLMVAGAGLAVAGGAIGEVQYQKGYIGQGERIAGWAGAALSLIGVGSAVKVLTAAKAAGGMGGALLGESRAVAGGIQGFAKSGASGARSLFSGEMGFVAGGGGRRVVDEVVEGAGEVADSAGARLAANRAKGLEGQAAVPGDQNTVRVYKSDGSYRVPDRYDPTAGTIGEIKNVAYQGLTRQLRDYVGMAQAEGMSGAVDLYVRESTTLSGGVMKMIEEGKIIPHVEYMPW